MLANVHKERENYINSEIRNIACDSIKLFDKLYSNLDESQSNELHELEVKMCNFFMNHTHDHKLFYNAKKN